MSAPAWAADAATLAGVAGAIAAAFFAGWKGWNSKSRRKPEAEATILAGDIMDTRPMQRLAEEVERLHERIALQSAAEDRSAAAADRLAAQMGRTEDVMRDMIREFTRRN